VPINREEGSPKQIAVLKVSNVLQTVGDAREEGAEQTKDKTGAEDASVTKMNLDASCVVNFMLIVDLESSGYSV